MTFHRPPSLKHHHSELGQEAKQRSKLGRIDFSGALSLGLANISLILYLDQIQHGWGNIIGNPYATAIIMTWLISTATFVLVEAFWAREPILPLRLLRNRNVVSAYIVQLLETAAYVAVCAYQPHLP